MDLFDYAAETNRAKSQPLAARMRPSNLDDYIGQEHIIGKGRLLRRAIEVDQLTSAIFYGPPGSGKTTLAQIIAQSSQSTYCSLSAVTSGIADMRQVIKQAAEDLKLYGKRSLLFIDEIHRFNKAQQDALLPSVEDGTIILIGATTENPYFEVNRALLSRSRIFRLNPLSNEDICQLLRRSVIKDQVLSALNLLISDQAFEHWAALAAGDVRTAYNALELAALSTPPNSEGQRIIDAEIAAESIQKPVISYDKSGDMHYDIISAFIKSMRGSNPDATLHWLARMIAAGENPEFMARRIVICAAEDVGLADPNALVVAMAAADAVHFIGWPEARIILAEAAIYVAAAPKSNRSYMAINQAMADLDKQVLGAVPIHLRDSSYQGAAKMGHGKDYKYPHDYPQSFVNQQYLPQGLENARYYYPGENGIEKRIKDRLDLLHNRRDK